MLPPSSFWRCQFIVYTEICQSVFAEQNKSKGLQYNRLFTTYISPLTCSFHQLTFTPLSQMRTIGFVFERLTFHFFSASCGGRGSPLSRFMDTVPSYSHILLVYRDLVINNDHVSEMEQRLRQAIAKVTFIFFFCHQKNSGPSNIFCSRTLGPGEGHTWTGLSQMLSHLCEGTAQRAWGIGHKQFSFLTAFYKLVFYTITVDACDVNRCTYCLFFGVI